jgi:hypothetical protein
VREEFGRVLGNVEAEKVAVLKPESGKLTKRTHYELCAHQPRPATGQAAQRPRPLGGHPHLFEITRRQQPRERAGVSRSVFALAWLMAAACACWRPPPAQRAARSAWRLDRAAGRSSARRLRANNSICSRPVSILPTARTRPPSSMATSQKSRCTSSPMLRTGPPFDRRRCGERENGFEFPHAIR